MVIINETCHVDIDKLILAYNTAATETKVDCMLRHESSDVTSDATTKCTCLTYSRKSGRNLRHKRDVNVAAIHCVVWLLPELVAIVHYDVVLKTRGRWRSGR